MSVRILGAAELARIVALHPNFADGCAALSLVNCEAHRVRYEGRYPDDRVPATADDIRAAAIGLAPSKADAIRVLASLEYNCDEARNDSAHKTIAIMRQIIALLPEPIRDDPPGLTTVAHQSPANDASPVRAIDVTEIRSRDHRSHGRIWPGSVSAGHQARIVPGEKITLHGTHNGASYMRTFRIGDTAEYGSYNLSYHGKIVSIGEKTVSIQHDTGVSRLSLHEFDWRNFDLDMDVEAARNFQTMMDI